VSASEDFWDDILGHLKQRVLVPVVGPELVTVAAGERRATLSRAIGERIAARYQLEVDWTPQSGLDEAIGAYLAARGRGEANRLYRVVNDVLLDLNPEPPESLRRLAQIRDFDLFVSTTFDPLLARAINEARFRGEARTRELWFSPNQSTAEQQQNARPPSPDEAVVFKLFGEVSSLPQYAIHDEDVLEWLHALVSETARLPEWLISRLKGNPILFIGCHLSDWVGRMLTRMASNDRLSLASKQFFIVGEGIRRYPGLVEFFKAFCGAARVQVLTADPTAFVAELHERWLKRTSQTSSVGGDPTGTPSAAAVSGSIFISYVREDAAEARRLADAISKIGGDVWFDERRLEPGDRWENEIRTSIRREVRLFVPVISNHTEQREEGYVFKEWGEAVARARGILRRRFIVPVVIDDDYDGDPTRYRQVPDEFMQLHFGRAPNGNPDDELVAMLMEEIRAMRRKEAA